MCPIGTERIGQMDQPIRVNDLGHISFTYDREHGVSHSIDLGYPGDDLASLMLNAVNIIENFLSYSFLISSEGESESGSAILVLQSISEMTQGLRKLQSSVVLNNPTLKEVYDLAQITEPVTN